MTTLTVPSVILLVTGLAASAAPSPRQERRDLSPSVPVERELSAGEHHKYRIALVPGQYLEVAVVQRSVDVVVSLFGPNEEMIREHASQGGFPANRISEIKGIIDPTTAEEKSQSAADGPTIVSGMAGR